jgi:hypothetical protein
MNRAVTIAVILSLGIVVYSFWPVDQEKEQFVPSHALSLAGSILADYNFGKSWRQQWKLPDGLHEVSGIAVVDENNVLIHNDESAVVYQYTVDSQQVTARFQLGEPALALDIEGIAILDGDVFLMTSTGIIYQVIDGVSRSGVIKDYQIYDTGLKDTCELEGLSVDLNQQSLVLLCKDMYSKGADFVSLYRFKTGQISKIMDLPFSSLAEGKKIHPSGIETRFGHYIILAGKEHLLIETTSQGEIVNIAKLKKKHHKQTEGIGFLSNQKLILADEGEDKKGRITIYRASKPGKD